MEQAKIKYNNVTKLIKISLKYYFLSDFFPKGDDTI